MKAFYQPIGKRIFDLFLSSLILITVFPLLYIILGILIKLDTQGPVIFYQYRIGRGGRMFVIFKFRTYTYGCHSQVTRIGKILRKFSLDEFPQFWNVLIGNMSIVGPRPFSREGAREWVLLHGYERRNEVLPGITGPSQVSRFRVAESMQGKISILKLDLEYVKKVSFGKDLGIILRTILLFFYPNGK